MSPIERLALPFKRRNEREIAQRAGAIVTSLQNAEREDVPGPFQFGIGIAPLILGSERYINAVNDQVAHGLGKTGLADTFAYNEFMTKQLCSDGDVVTHGQWPSEMKPRLSIAFSRIQ